MSAKAPQFSAAEIKAAKEFLDEKSIRSFLFSDGTYQIEMVSPKTKGSFSPFLHINDSGKILDCFCTCKAAEKKKSCAHLAAASELIFRGHTDPLHVRFRDSLWNQLALIASQRHGYESNCLKVENGSFEAHSVSGKRLFFIKASNEKIKKKLQDLFFHRPLETEETSLKFSNLPHTELTLWKQGRPTPKLRYELSFWADLAKWWMLLQDAGAPYKIDFTYDDETLPKWIEIQFKEFTFGFYLAEMNWPKLIPALATVTSPLTVSEHSYRTIQKMTYDPAKQEMILDFKGENQEVTGEESVREGIEMGEWLFIPRKGFYPGKLDPLLKERIVPKQRLAIFLQRHAKLVKKHLVGTSIVLEELDAQYELSFDDKLALHIRCYVFEPGDLQKRTSVYFGPWVYIENKGFFLLQNLFFEGAEKVVSKPLVADFVSRHRHWLAAFEGFQTHPSSLESHLSYALMPDKSLRFDTRVEFGEEQGELSDFGEWIYIKGKGFYAKRTGRTGARLRAGLRVPAPEISTFITTHVEELEQIPNFFSDDTPLEKLGLKISFNEKNQILVKPESVFKKGYTQDLVQIFGDYTYVKDEGFYEVPPDCKLPDVYQAERVIDEASEPYFVSYELDLLAPFILSSDPRLRKPKTLFLRILQIKPGTKDKSSHWLVDFVYESDIGMTSVYEVWNGIAENKRYIFTGAGLIFLRQLRFAWLKGLPKKRWLKGGERLKISTLEWLKLSVSEEIRDPEGTSKEAKSSRKVLEEFRSFQTHELVNLEGFQSRLRPYQEIGVRWLWFLYCHGLSGLLCDEMGLGKTHQAMGLLAAIYNAEVKDEKDRKKHLVVCPTSVIYHWEDLLKRFLPHFRVSVYHGQGRKLENGYDLLLTSYGTLRSEKKPLAKIDFEVAVFDEIQSAKNPQSQTHRALKEISSQMRLGLTGTPIENRLLELKALFDLVVPHYLPGEAIFKEQFISPIEKSQDPEKKFVLARLIKPFIMRRKKSEVLLELPEKIEEIAYCPLSDEQRKLYRETVAARKAAIEKELSESSKPVPLVHIFSLISSLKQICDHPALFADNVAEYHKHSSGKWALFVELLDEIRDSGQKVVVFSQYLGMLDMIEAYLKEKKIGFAGIRGSTRNRKEQLDRFRDDPKCEVFVASLQAAGVGVDLVSASVVIHYDRWWNPARENQATDRVHRIGQKRGVQVFKMVTKGTIEEHIHQLIERKLTLMEGVVGFDEHDQIKGLDREELQELLRLMEPTH
ncbi:MAG: DEAD/DEAH box helicase [Chlamydiales bacterium]|nr:DEAD/DEAH box helicase [Chlamydiales bacterium]